MKVLISLAIILMYSFNSYATTYVGEQATLESIYEAKARAVLNTILRPKDYSIVISAKINEDQTELEQFREDLEMRFLPGLPIEAQNDLSPATNELHSLKESIDINVILNKDVDTSKEALVRKLLVSKLHLDLDDGDTINIIKTLMPGSIVDKKPEKKPEVKQEKVIPKDNRLFYSLLAGLAFLAFCLWLFRPNRKSKENDNNKAVRPVAAFEPYEDSINKTFDNNMNYTFKEEKPEEESSESKEQEAALLEQERLKEIRKNYLESIKKESLSLMTEYPNLCVDAISEMVRENKSANIIAFFETIGWDDSRRLMSNLPIKQWGTLGAVLKKREATPTKEQYERALESCHKELVAKVISHGINEDKDNPFSFIFTLPYTQKKELYENEDVANVAIICLFSNSADLQDIFTFLTAERKKDVVLKIAEFQKLSDMEIKMLRNQLVENLNNIKTSGGISANGLEVAAKVLRSLPPVKEQEIFTYIEQTDKGMADQINHFNLQFAKIRGIPLRYQEAIYESMDSDQIAKLIYGLDELTQQFVLNILPKNKARMVSSDLQGHISPTKDEVAILRREVVTKIEQIITKSGEELRTVIDFDVDKKGA